MTMHGALSCINGQLCAVIARYEAIQFSFFHWIASFVAMTMHGVLSRNNGQLCAVIAWNEAIRVVLSLDCFLLRSSQSQ
jgi:hypothetical protein